MTKAAKKAVTRVKKLSRKVASKTEVKKTTKKKNARAKPVKAATRSFVQSARMGAVAAAETGKGLIKRAIDTVVEVAKPLIPDSTGEKPKGD